MTTCNPEDSRVFASGQPRNHPSGRILTSLDKLCFHAALIRIYNVNQKKIMKTLIIV
jgi:hypothetical protein